MAGPGGGSRGGGGGRGFGGGGGFGGGSRGGFGGGLMSVVICISISCVAYYLLLCLRVFNLEDLRKMLNMHKKSAVRLDIQTNLHQEG